MLPMTAHRMLHVFFIVANAVGVWMADDLWWMYIHALGYLAGGWLLLWHPKTGVLK